MARAARETGTASTAAPGGSPPVPDVDGAETLDTSVLVEVIRGLAGQKSQEGKPSPPLWIELSKLFAAGAIAALATIVVGYFTFFNTSRELDIRMVELSLSILGGEKGGVDTDETDGFGEYEVARRFAVRALKRYAGVTLSDEEEKAWAESGSVSFGKIPLASPQTPVTDDNAGKSVTLSSWVTDESGALALAETSFELTGFGGALLTVTQTTVPPGPMVAPVTPSKSQVISLYGVEVDSDLTEMQGRIETAGPDPILSITVVGSDEAPAVRIAITGGLAGLGDATQEFAIDPSQLEKLQALWRVLLE